MKPSERTVLQACFEKTKKLFETKRQPEDWADNIIQGSSGLKTKLQWKHFYTWLANPNNYDEENTSNLTIEPQILENIEPYPEHMVVETYQNGPAETLIRVINTRPLHYDSDDEKVHS